MSAVTKSWAPTKGNPAAAAQRKKIILLAVLAVMLIAVLAFEVPRIMHRGGAEPASTPDTSTGLVTDQIGTAGATADAANATTAATTASADSAAQTGTTVTPAATPSATSPVTTAPKASKAILAIRHRPAKDPFVPLLGETTTAPNGASTTGASTTGASTQVSTPAATATPKHESTPVAVGATPSISTTPSLTTTPPVPSTHTATKAASSGTKAHGTSKHAAAPEVVPTVAVVNTGGKQQAVAVGQYFKAGNLWFQLVALHPKSMELAVVGGGFTGGKQTITVGLNDPVTLYNTATGVEYPLRLTRATTGITTTSQSGPGNAASATAPAGDQSTTTSTSTATDPAAPDTTTS